MCSVIKPQFSTLVVKAAQIFMHCAKIHRTPHQKDLCGCYLIIIQSGCAMANSSLTPLVTSGNQWSFPCL
jgi:hypothetical protein